MEHIYQTIILAGNSIILLGTLLVGIIVLYQGLSRKMGNLMILGLLYLLTSSSKVIQFAFSLQWAQIAYFQTAIPFLILEFTRRTFFKDRDDTKKLTLFFYITTTITYIGAAVFAYQYTLTEFQDRSLYNVASLFDIITVGLPNIYTVIASLDAIKQLDPKIVEGYIIARLRLWMYLSIILAFGYSLWIAEIVIPGDASYAILNTISMVVGLIHMIGSYLLWVLPSWFKQYLNRGSQVETESQNITDQDLELQEEERKEIEKVDMLKILGSYLANYIDTSELAARGHLRYAARNAFDDLTVRGYNYDKWNTVLGDPLVQQITKLALDVDPLHVSKMMQNDLKDSQAIITMAAN